MRCIWIDDQLSDEKYGEQYKELFHDMHVPPIKLFTTKDALAYIENNHDFDSVVLDLNMEFDESLKEEETKHNIKSILTDKFYQDNKSNIDKITGYALYLKLIYNGFPKENICFLSANVVKEKDNKSTLLEIKEMIVNDVEEEAFLSKLEEFGLFIQVKKGMERTFKEGNREKLLLMVDRLLEKEQGTTSVTSKNEVKQKFGDILSHLEVAGLQRPTLCTKGNVSDNKDFDAWKRNIRDNDYLTLRTGIILACDQLIRMVEDIPDNEFEEKGLQFLSYVENKNSRGRRNKKEDSEKLEIYKEKQHYLHLLTSIKHTLPVREPSVKLKNNDYKQVLNFLSHDWESASQVKYSFKADRLNTQAVQNNTFGCIMMLLRNWMAHNKIKELSPNLHSTTEDVLRERDIAFLFMVAMRSFFRIPPFTQPYEKVLFELFKEPISDQVFLTLIESDLIGEIKESFREITHRDSKWYMPEPSVYQKFVNIGHNEGVSVCAMNDFYKMFWHGMFFTDWKDKGKQSDATQWGIEVNVAQSVPRYPNNGKVNYNRFIVDLYKYTYSEFDRNC